MYDDERMPFGKYRNERLADVPVEYLDWLLGSEFLRDPLKQRIIDHLQSSRAAEWARLGEDQ